MPDDTDSIAALQRTLTVYRRTIEFLDVQRAQFGAFTPPYIWHQFDDTRSEIARLKRSLRELGVVVEDLPGDADVQHVDLPAAARAVEGEALLSIYRRMLVDQARYVSLAGMSRWNDLSLPLVDLYVEPALTPMGSATGTAPHAIAGTPLSTALPNLAQQPAARMLIEGLPGSGKTTCLRWLALACASHGAGGPSPNSIGGWPDPLPLPLLLTAREIASALTRKNAAPDVEHMPTLSAFWSAIAEWLQYSDLAALVPTIQQLLERGGCLLLIDGLDDLPATASRHGFMAALSRFVARYPDNRYVLACRDYDAASMASLAGFARYRLGRLDQPRTDAMIAQWYPVIAGQAGLLVPEDVSERIARLQGALRGDPKLQELSCTTLTLALAILAHVENHLLPSRRGVVLRRLADVLLRGWDHSRLGGGREPPAFDLDAPVEPERELTLLAPVALALQSRFAGGHDQLPTLGYAEIESLLCVGSAGAGVDQRGVSQRAVPQLLTRWCSRGLLAQPSPGAYAMPHRQVREYLAARGLAALPNFPPRAYAVRREPRWREVLLLAVQELGAGRAPHIARLLVRLLLHPPEPDHGGGAHDLLLAAECLVELAERSQPDRALRTEVCGRLAELLGSATHATAERVQAGMLLGHLCDPRYMNLLPHVAKIGGGGFILGTLEGYEDEGPAQWVYVSSFAIGVYPVTNHEYAAFLAERSTQAPPHYWHDSRFNNPACPVVGVTWHDANAYCAWLTERLARAGLLEPGMVVRLPLEVEWEKAASWDELHQAKLRYPWGDEWSSACANTADGRGAWMTAPVGCYPAGGSRYGVQDCIGNVWEWTGSVYENYPGAAKPFHEPGSYTLRGSSCASNPTHARCTYRSRLPASYWRYHLGFRIVIGHPPQPLRATVV